MNLISFIYTANEINERIFLLLLYFMNLGEKVL